MVELSKKSRFVVIAAPSLIWIMLFAVAWQDKGFVSRFNLVWNLVFAIVPLPLLLLCIWFAAVERKDWKQAPWLYWGKIFFGFLPVTTIVLYLMAIFHS